MLGLNYFGDMPPLQRKCSVSSGSVSSRSMSSSSVSSRSVTSMPDTRSSMDDADTLASLTDMLTEHDLSSNSFTGLLFGELVADACELTRDDAKSDSDSGYRTSPPVSGDDTSLDSWLFKSISSSDTNASLPSISSIMPPTQTSTPDVGNMNSHLASNVFSFNTALSNDNGFESEPDTRTFTDMPAQSPIMGTSILESIKIKDEPADTYDDAACAQRQQNAYPMPAMLNSTHTQVAHGNTPSSPKAPFEMLSEDAIKTEDAEHLFRLKFSPHVLPPCRVCGAQATGYHYGANTCEPCKGFYHRMTKRADKTPICLKDGKCAITSKNRGACPACRFQKCVVGGMCKENIKTGRYSYSKRSKDIIELQRSFSHTAVIPQQQQTQRQQQQAYQYLLKHSALSSSSVTLQQKLEENMNSDYDPQSEHIIRTLRAARDRIVGKMLHTTFTISNEEMQRIREFSKNESHSVFLQWIHNGFKHNFWSGYIKAIPGFKDLTMTDQITIIKRSFVEFWAVSRHRLFDLENGVYHCAGSGATIQLQEILDEQQYNALMNAVRRLQSLKLSVDEACVLSAFVVLNIETDGLVEPGKVEEVQSELLRTLSHALKQQRARPLTTFSHIISALTELRAGCHRMANLAIFPEDATPPLFREIVLAADR